MRALPLYLIFFLIALTWMGFESGIVKFERADRIRYDRNSAWNVED